MKHLIDFKGFSPEWMAGIISRGIEVKRNPAEYAGALKGKKLYLLFQKTSTRTALSFSFGMTGLGGEYFMQNWEDSNFAVGEIRDEIRYVSRNVDIVMARLKNNEDLRLMAGFATVPVINGCCNKYHPCQAMADLLTVKELFGNLKTKLMYIGVRNNVLNSLMGSLPFLGGELYAATPIINQPSIDDELYAEASGTGRFHDIGKGNPGVEELYETSKKMDVLYTDTWVDMEFINDKKASDLKDERTARMMPFQINRKLLEGSRAIVMHDMPLHAGYEISREAAEAHMDTILRQAENRKYAQQAILLDLLER